MGESGSVMWMFDKVSLVQATKDNDKDVEEEAIEAGAEDMEKREGSYTFYGKWEDLSSLRENLVEQGWKVIKTELAYRAKDKIILDNEKAEDIKNLLMQFNENPDCKSVYTNCQPK